MKYFIFAIMILFATLALADSSKQCQTQTGSTEIVEQLEIKTDVPKHLEGATITITLKDGRTSTVPAEKFKVVPRKQQFITTQTRVASQTTCSVEDVKHHRVSVLGGSGSKDGLDRDNSQDPNKVTVENRTGAVFGAQYQYRSDLKVFDMPLSIGVQGQTNKTGSLLLGLDF